MYVLIAYCGLDCSKCEARLATVNDDDGLRTKVAKEWSELNNVEITPDQINCMGCRTEGVKTPYCDGMCPIRRCALERNHETCRDCSEMSTCRKVGIVIDNNDEARQRLTGPQTVF